MAECQYRSVAARAATFPDREKAEKAFDKATLLAASGSALPADWIDLTDRFGAFESKTFVTALGTALLARATEARADPMSLQVDAPTTKGLRAYSARGLASRVLVPKCRQHGVHQGRLTDDPIQNHPFTGHPRIDDITNPKHGAEFAALRRAIEDVRGLSKPEATEALAAWIRVRQDVHASNAATVAAATAMVATAGLTPASLVLRASSFVRATAATGRTGHALVAAAMSFLYPKIVARNVHASSRKVPGDVLAGRKEPEVSIEVKQKEVDDHQVRAFTTSIAKAGFERGAYVAIAPSQAPLPALDLTAAAAAEGVSLAVYSSPEEFLSSIIVTIPEGETFLSEFPARMIGLLSDLDAERATIEACADALGVKPARAVGPRATAASARRSARRSR